MFMLVVLLSLTPTNASRTRAYKRHEMNDMEQTLAQETAETVERLTKTGKGDSTSIITINFNTSAARAGPQKLWPNELGRLQVQFQSPAQITNEGFFQGGPGS